MSSDPQFSATNNATDEQPTVMSPSIFQAWLGACIGIALKLVDLRNFFQSKEIPWLNLALLVSGETMAGVLAGLGLAVLFKAVQLRRLNWLQPGHWFAVEMLLVVVAGLASYPWAEQPGFVVGISAFFMSQLVNGVALGLGGTIWFVLIVRTTSERTSWKVVAWTSLALYGATLLMMPASIWGASQDSMVGLGLTYGAFFISVLAIYVRLIAGLVALVQDLRHGTPRDTLHWTCLALAILAPVARTLGMLLRA